jgi:hypothetical protein
MLRDQSMIDGVDEIALTPSRRAAPIGGANMVAQQATASENSCIEIADFSNHAC